MDYLARSMEKFPNLHTIRIRTQRALTRFGAFSERYYPQIRHVIAGEDNIEIINSCPSIEKFDYDFPSPCSESLLYSSCIQADQYFLPQSTPNYSHPYDPVCYRLLHQSYVTKTSFPELRELNIHWDLSQYVSLVIICRYFELIYSVSLSFETISYLH